MTDELNSIPTTVTILNLQNARGLWKQLGHSYHLRILDPFIVDISRNHSGS